jgi:hypothetical protein
MKTVKTKKRDKKRKKGEMPGKTADIMAQISLSLSERIFEVKYNGDISDLGNEIGFVLGNVITDLRKGEITDFMHGLQHGISLTNGTH